MCKRIFGASVPNAAEGANDEIFARFNPVNSSWLRENNSNNLD